MSLVNHTSRSKASSKPSSRRLATLPYYGSTSSLEKETSPGASPVEITAKRRAERKQFKLDRAKAIAAAAAAAAEADTAFNEQGRVIAHGIAPDGTRIIPSAATWKPTSEAFFLLTTDMSFGVYSSWIVSPNPPISST
ncbi:hypothetical protein BDR05DRAFT_1055980 [Suillus weaverae]|nr:hypothetical protein BDR05DRAFT_1055980 [Suillus weaverae]